MSASGKRLSGFQVDELAMSMEDNAPELSLLISSLLSPLTQKVLPYMSGEPMGDEDENKDEQWAAAEGPHTNEKGLWKEDTRNQQCAAIVRIICIAPFYT